MGDLFSTRQNLLFVVGASGILIKWNFREFLISIKKKIHKDLYLGGSGIFVCISLKNGVYLINVQILPTKV